MQTPRGIGKRLLDQQRIVQHKVSHSRVFETSNREAKLFYMAKLEEA